MKAPLIVILLAGAAVLAGCDCGGGSCETVCGGECVDLGTDPGNCGACGVSCGTATCVAGMCEADDAGTTDSGTTDSGTTDAGATDAGLECPAGRMLCRTGCVTPWNPTHCGSTPARGCLEMPCGSNDGCDGVRCVPTSSALDRVFASDPLDGSAVIGLFNFVCPSSLTPELAQVMCVRWGLAGGEVIAGDADYATSITPYEVTCAGTESSLEDCVNTETTRDAACLEPARLVRCFE